MLQCMTDMILEKRGGEEREGHRAAEGPGQIGRGQGRWTERLRIVHGDWKVENVVQQHEEIVNDLDSRSRRQAIRRDASWVRGL